ncbi:MAG TPA: 7-cyano-7-deazaguanine synthase QueC [Vicinamibacteria bacterium]|nr:7-cyano-7-deazaguanine synthase QueC [Vicinamibacteria bacterium]
MVCVSGGMDSCVTAALAARDHRLAFLHANYGQRTQARELACFHRLGDHFRAERRLVVDFPGFEQIGGSSLTDPGIPVREGQPVEGVIPTSYVPFRNAHVLSAAASWGEVVGARAIFVGAVWEDSSGYPDCRPEFYRAFEEAIRLGTRPETAIRIVTPVIRMSKSEIVREGLKLRVPFEMTWSCYQAETEACGACESCVLRLKGFRDAGAEDPIRYRTPSRA